MDLYLQILALIKPAFTRQRHVPILTPCSLNTSKLSSPTPLLYLFRVNRTAATSVVSALGLKALGRHIRSILFLINN
jgi:hypothetical protein